jgi:hypothetical protein
LSEKQSGLRVLSEEQLRRERIRGVFAVGAIAVLYYLRQIAKYPGPIPLGQTPQFLLNAGVPLIAINSDEIMYLWAAYVIAVAVALADQMVPADRWYSKLFAGVFEVAYGMAHIAYIFGIILLALAGVFFLLPLLALLAGFYAANLLLTKEGRARIKTGLRGRAKA